MFDIELMFVVVMVLGMALIGMCAIGYIFFGKDRR